MKTKSFFLALFAITSLCLNAQSDYSNYLNKAMSEIEEGDCASAQKFYNVYKELTERQVASIEVLIKDCEEANKYQIGQKLLVDGKEYTIAYLTENKLHGFAILDIGTEAITYPYHDTRMKSQKIPSLDELNLIYENNAKIGLTGQYWSRTKSDKYTFTGEGAGYYCYLIVKDFITGKTIHSDCRNTYGVLLLYRF